MPQQKKNFKKRGAGGRPRKFDHTSRPITMTLPQRTLEILAGLDSDRARAVVKATDAMVSANGGVRPAVEVVRAEDDKGVIIVGPSSYLNLIPFLQRIEISPSRYLLAIPTGTSIEALEIAVMDLLSEVPATEEYELNLLKQLSHCLAHQRRGKHVSKAELLLVDLRGK